MKTVIVVMIMAWLLGCGQVTGPVGPQGPGAVSPVSLEGYYTLLNGGYLDVYDDAANLVSFRSARIVVSNTDGSTGVLPITSLDRQATVSGKVYSNTNQTYSATNNVKIDGTSTVITGSLLTEVYVSKLSNGQLSVVVMINNSSGLLFNHTLLSQ